MALSYSLWWGLPLPIPKKQEGAEENGQKAKEQERRDSDEQNPN